MSKKTDAPAQSGESLLGDILLEEVVEALDEARGVLPIIVPPLPHAVSPADRQPHDPKAKLHEGHSKGEVANERPDTPGHHRHGG